ncbi:PAS domain S-box protein [bacterium]|nr:PAS domain S-box protein [bacterium]
MSDPKWKDWVRNKLFEYVPCNIAIIDREYNIVESNHHFLDLFGDGINKKCYSVYHKRISPCKLCPTIDTFSDGKIRVIEGEGLDKDGFLANYIVHIAPIYDENGEIPYVIEMSTEITESKRLQKEYQVLFEKVPCYVAVLNRDYRVVKGNELFRKTFGESTGDRCYKLYKKRNDKCPDCPAERTFTDSEIHISKHKGVNVKGEETYYVVTTSPLIMGESKTQYVIEMAIDVTETEKLTEMLEKANTYRKYLIRNITDAVIAVDNKGHTIIFNPSAEELLKYKREDLIGKSLPDGIYITEYFKALESRKENWIIEETTVKDKNGKGIPVRYTGVILKSGEEKIGEAFFLRDLSVIKELQREIIEAERLAAVGQTVAGLAHGIKNILTGLEGGMYVVSSGMKKGEEKKIQQGWEMMNRNIGRISTLVKDLLSFSKGKIPNVSITNPNDLVEKVIELFRDSAKKSNIQLIADLNQNTKEAPLEPEDMCMVLENLVSNAIDASQQTEKESTKIVISCRDEGNNLIFEVSDEGCGMEYEVKQKVFTNFFTTKGGGGTGIGLLLTRKITYEHGGKIEFTSTPGKGSVFKLIFPRSRLPKVTNEKEV